MDVLLEPIPEGWKATALPLRELSAQGQTEAEAVLNLQSQSLKQLPQGSKIVQVALPQEGKNEHPWLAIAGSMVDDPFWEEYQEGIREYRRRVDEAED